MPIGKREEIEKFASEWLSVRSWPEQYTMASLLQHRIERSLQLFKKDTSLGYIGQKKLIKVLKGEIQGINFDYARNPAGFIHTAASRTDFIHTAALRAALVLYLKKTDMAARLFGAIKTGLLPIYVFTSIEHVREYAGNPYGLCVNLSLLWLKAHFVDDDMHSKKGDFFAATTSSFMPALNHAPTLAEKEIIVSKLLERLRERNFGIMENWETTQDDIYSMPIAGVYAVHNDGLGHTILNIIQDMAIKHIPSLGIRICTSTHAMAMVIKRRTTYSSVIFYDPNSQYGDVKIAIPVIFNEKHNQSEILSKINMLLRQSEYLFSYRGNVTLTCMNTKHSNNARLYNFSEQKQIEQNINADCRLTCLIDLIRATGKNVILLEIISQILKCSPNVLNQKFSMEGASDICPLALASENNRVAIVNILLSQPGIDLNAKNRNGSTPLMWAASNGHVNVVEILVSRPGIDLNAKDNDDNTTLILAASSGHVNVVGFLVLHPGIDLNAKNRNGSTPLMWAAVKDYINVVEILVSRPGIDLNAKDNDGNTALILAASNGHVNVVEILVSRPGIDLNAKDNDGNTALILAASNGHVNVVEILVSRPGIDLNAKDSNGYTALMWAASNGHVNVVEILVSRPGIDLNAKDSNGYTTLIWAAVKGHANIIKILVSRPGIDLNAKDSKGYTTLMWAAVKGHANIIKILVSRPGIDLNAKDIDGNTALMWAQATGHANIIKILVSRPEIRG